MLYKKSKSEYFIKLSKYLDNNEKKFIITANPETFKLAMEDDEVYKMIKNEANDVIPDGIAVVRGARKLGIEVDERIAGIDVATKILELLNNKKKTLYLFGAKNEVLEKLKEVIKSEYPCIKVLGSSHGYVADKDKIFEEIVSLNPDVCLVALGIPLQEKLINRYIGKARKGIYVGVGGSFDVLSGAKKRAPKIFIKMNLEWLYRIIREPSRLKRFYNNNVKFMKEVYKERKK